MAELTATPVFAKTSPEMKIAKAIFILGALVIGGVIVGSLFSSFGASESFSNTAYGVAALASVLNLFAILMLAVVLHLRTQE